MSFNHSLHDLMCRVNRVKDGHELEDYPSFVAVEQRLLDDLKSSQIKFCEDIIRIRAASHIDYFEKLAAAAKEKGRYEQLIETLIYLATWGDCVKLALGADDKTLTTYFGFTLYGADVADQRTVPILTGGCAWEEPTNRWTTHT